MSAEVESQMKILVRRQRTDTISVTSSANERAQIFNDQVSEQDLNSEVELLNSKDLMRKVAVSTGSGLAKPAGLHRTGWSEIRSPEP